MAIRLSIAKDFSETPGPRKREEGDYSGEQFLEEQLKPAFIKARDSHQSLVVDFDGAVGYATSFLEAAFGGLARIYDPKDVLETLELICKDEPSLVEEVKHYIEEANSKETTQQGR
jgi:hypothetical protein